MLGLKGESWKLCPTDGPETRDRELISNQFIHILRLVDEGESEPNKICQRNKKGESQQ